jgi:hypothetical protein
VDLSRDPSTRPDLGVADMGSVNLGVWNADSKTLRAAVLARPT